MTVSRLFQVRIVMIALIASAAEALAQPSYPLSRPILFVHGWCADARDWNGTLVADVVATHLKAENPSLYPDKQRWDLYYDLNEPVEELRVKFYPSGAPLSQASFDYPPRFFSITFRNAERHSFDAVDVAGVSIVNKAGELAGVIRAIVRLTRISDVLVVAHSMGGLVTRSYMENLLASAPCSSAYTCLSPTLRDPVLDHYSGDVAGLLTIDTPHSGAGLAFLAGNIDAAASCFGASTLNRHELASDSDFILALNYSGSHPFAVADPLPFGVAVQSIATYRSDHPFQASDGLLYYWDDVVDSQEQAIRYALGSHLTEWLIDSGNPFTDDDLPEPCRSTLIPSAGHLLHSLSCVGNQVPTESLVLNFLRARLAGVVKTCTSFTISPPSASTPVTAGSRQVVVTGAPSGCQGGNWAASGNGNWIRVSPSTGTAGDSVTVSWTANPNASPRAGTATIAGSSFSVNQAGATVAAPPSPYLLGPGSPVFPGTTSGSVSPTFFWLAVPSTDQYELELSDAGGTVVNRTVPAAQTSIVPTVLADNHAYKWRMRSHGAPGWGNWGNYYYFSTFTGLTSGDFGISAAPGSGGVAQGSVSSHLIVTSTLAGAPQTVTLSVGALPSGVTAWLSPNSVQSGGISTLTLTVSPTASTGGFVVVVTGSGSTGVTHTVSVGLTVNPGPGTGQPAVCLTPSSLSFSDQVAGTTSPVQMVTLQNCGTGPLHIASFGASPEFFIGPGSFAAPLDLIVGGATSFQVGFAPAGAGTRTGTVKVFSNAASSPAVLTLSGSGTAAPITTGTVVVKSTLNGQPYAGFIGFTLSGPNGPTNFGTVPMTIPGRDAGSYTLALQPGGGLGTFTGITPSASQVLTAGGSVTFSLNFTIANQMSFRCPTSTSSGTTVPLVVARGASGSLPLTVSGQGGVQTVSLSIAGLPGGVVATFSPSTLTIPAPTGSVDATSTMAVSAETPPGVYYFTIAARNLDGLVLTLVGTLLIPENVAVEAENVSSGGNQGNSLAGWATMSDDGHLVALSSAASNLVAGDTNGTDDIFIRNRTLHTTSRVSVATDGSQANDWSGHPTMSSDGRFVAFRSLARNLTTGAAGTVGNIYLRDTVENRTIRVSSAPDGSAANGECFLPSVSADGRFVVFSSLASNLLYGVGGGQVYLHDILLGRTTLVSRSGDGTPGDQSSAFGTISGDGKYIAFVSSATNLVPGATVAGRQVFVLDRETGLVENASGAPDGGAANGSIVTYNWDERGPSISADGRIVAFASNATNLVAGLVDDNYDGDVFVRDRRSGVTTAVSVTNNGAVLGGHWFSMSADGRYVAFLIRWTPLIHTVAVRDRVQDRTVVFTGNASGQLITAGSSPESTDFLAISPNGRRVTISSKLSNLITGDANGQQDVFGIGPAADGPVYVQSLALTPGTVIGGGTATGTITLNGPAPAGGATVVLSSSRPEASVAPAVVIPSGLSSTSFPLVTLPVSASTAATVMASGGGASAWGSLAIAVPVSSRIDAWAGDGQKAYPGQALSTPFSARVVDGTNNPVIGATVQFTAPTLGPSGTFAGSASSYFVVTDQSGMAVAPAFSTNGVGGPFAVTARTAGVMAPAVFGVNNGSYGFYPLTPCRLLDTRNSSGPDAAAPALAAGDTRPFVIAGKCGLPSTARAVSVNQTVTGTTSLGDLVVYRGDLLEIPSSSSISFRPGVTRANNGIVELSRDGSGAIGVSNRSAGSTQFILDVNGYFE